MEFIFIGNNRLIARAYKGKEVGFYSPFTTIGKTTSQHVFNAGNSKINW